MGDTTQHGELGMLPKPKPFAHPREEVSETVVSSSDTLRDSSTPARER